MIRDCRCFLTWSAALSLCSPPDPQGTAVAGKLGTRRRGSPRDRPALGGGGDVATVDETLTLAADGAMASAVSVVGARPADRLADPGYAYDTLAVLGSLLSRKEVVCGCQRN
jgi:hypothetical protein